MPITATCSCGKKLTVGDGLVGKTLKCPKCGNPVMISAAPLAGGVKPKQQSVNPKIAISSGMIMYMSIGAICLIIAMTFYFGPMRVWNQWEAIGPKADDDVRSVVTFALQAYLSEKGDFDPSKANAIPSVDGDIQFHRPTLAMSMPDKVKFTGKTNQGDFSGYYMPKNGEIEADVDFGGLAHAGMVNIRKSTGNFHMTGRLRDKHPMAESEGKSLQIVYRKADE